MATHLRRALAGVVATGAVAVASFAGAAAAVPAPRAAVTAPLLQQAGGGTVVNKSGTAIQATTQVETDTASWGSTVVSAYQMGRTTKGFGAATIGFATSTDSGLTWVSGLLPGLTSSSPRPNPAYPLVVNQSVAYDAAHGVWLVPSVTYVKSRTTFREKALMVNASTDGVTWQDPVTAVPTDVDKAWGVCDDTVTSPNFGRCYVAYSQLDSGYALAVVSTSDGGSTWSAPQQITATPRQPAIGYNAFPVVRPDGAVVIVATDYQNGTTGSALISSASTDGGATWSAPTTIATVRLHTVSKVRALNKPTVDVDADGVVTALWADCRFRTKCTTNDLVTSRSSDGVSWTAPTALPLAGPVADKFDPGLAVAPGVPGGPAQLSVVYYTTEKCGTTICLDAEYSTSYDSGTTWSAPYQVNTAPMPIAWFPNSPRGRMVGDYNSVSFVDGQAVTVLPLAAHAPTPFAVNEWALTLPPGWPGLG